MFGQDNLEPEKAERPWQFGGGEGDRSSPIEGNIACLFFGCPLLERVAVTRLCQRLYPPGVTSRVVEIVVDVRIVRGLDCDCSGPVGECRPKAADAGREDDEGQA